MIADLGLSKQLTVEITSTSYVEPQFFVGANYVRNKKSDIYSLGVILWEISSGCPPFLTIPYYSLIYKVSNGLRERPIRGTPEEYVNLYQKCWEEDPNLRPNIVEVINTLENILSKVIEDSKIAEDSKTMEDSKIMEDSKLMENSKILKVSRILEDTNIIEDPRVTNDPKIVEDSKITNELNITNSPKINVSDTNNKENLIKHVRSPTSPLRHEYKISKYIFLKSILTLLLPYY
jgi:hypothetical protein